MRWRQLKKKKLHSKSAISPILKVEYAGFWIRGLAVFIDTFMIIAPITFVIGVLFGYDALKHPEQNQWAGIVQMLFYAIVTISMWQIWGQTPGKKALNLYIVNAKTFERPSLLMYILHFLGYFVSMITLIGFFIGLLREDKRALHDLLANTAVIVKD